MRREAAPIRGLPTHTPGTVLKHVLGLMQFWWLGFAVPLYGEAGAKAPASLNFLLDKVSDQGISLPTAALTQGPPWCCFSEHSALIFSVLKTSMMHPYTIDVDTIRCGPRGDPTFRWRPQGCPRFLTCPARAAASRDRRMT